MFKVIRLPTKFSKTIKRFNQKEKAELLDFLIKIGDGENIKPPDSILGDTLELIYGEWMNMEGKNGNKPNNSLIVYPSEYVAPLDPSMSEPRVEYSRVEYSRVEDSRVEDSRVEESRVENNNKTNDIYRKFNHLILTIDEFSKLNTNYNR